MEPRHLHRAQTAVIAIARYLWAAPNTAFGVLLLPLVWLTRGRGQITNGVIELYGGILDPVLRRCVPIPGGASAMTLGHIIIAVDRRALEATRAHERVHVRQYERWGPFFLPAYFLASLSAAVAGKGAYHGNYFERQARQLDCQ
jgi:hypothetical protein